MAVLLGWGCDQPAPSAPTSPPPTSTTAPASAPATTRASARPSATMNVNGTPFVFPPARIRLDEEDGHVVALLYSDDPREALKDNYTGNSFYLRMELDITAPADLAAARWHFAAPSTAQQEDSPYGVFLTGRKIQLQPYKVDAAFKRDGDVTLVLVGQFQLLDSKPEHSPPRMVVVEAKLSAKLDPPSTRD
jgi:hypothetical protein